MRTHTVAVLIALLALFETPGFAQPIDQIPMYGGTDRSAEASLREADAKLIADTTSHFGSREKASAAFVGNGFAFYSKDDLANAMRRFNQAWLLDPSNPEVYWGFAVIRHDQGRNCEAMGLFEKAVSFGKYIEGMAPDAARAKVLCAVDDKTLSIAAREAPFSQAQQIYAEALIKERNKGYVHASMATAFYWEGKYSEAWASVKLARENGGRLPEQFLHLLRDKMPEPS